MQQEEQTRVVKNRVLGINEVKEALEKIGVKIFGRVQFQEMERGEEVGR